MEENNQKLHKGNKTTNTLALDKKKCKISQKEN